MIGCGGKFARKKRRRWEFWGIGRVINYAWPGRRTVRRQRQRVRINRERREKKKGWIGRLSGKGSLEFLLLLFRVCMRQAGKFVCLSNTDTQQTPTHARSNTHTLDPRTSLGCLYE